MTEHEGRVAVHDPRLGQDFGDYIVTRKLAEGGMGAVYLAEHPSGMRKVVKFMHAECLKVEAVRKRFETECLAAKRLKGRAGIVDIDTFGWRNGEMYLVMEHLDGVTLEAHIRQNGRLTEHHTYHVMLLILRALSALHGEEIVHRDLKPSNIFLRDTDERQWDPTLIDFGIVHDKHANTGEEFRTRENQMIGTVGYMATEQYGRANQVTPATDVFACAVMVFEMLTGHLPWGRAETEFAQYDRQLNHQPVWPAHVELRYAPGWKQLLLDALAPQPERRPASAQLFALLLAQHLEPIPPHVPSGLDMVARLVPKFLQNLPAQVETVRQPNGHISVARFWSPGTPLGGHPAAPSSGFDLAAIRVSAAMPIAQASAATLSARPSGSVPRELVSGTPTPASPTTLSSANGMATGTSGSQVRSTSSAGARLAAVGIATAIAITGVIVGVTQLRGRSSPHAGSSVSDAMTAAPSQPPLAPGEMAVPDEHESPAPTAAMVTRDAEPPTALPLDAGASAQRSSDPSSGTAPSTARHDVDHSKTRVRTTRSRHETSRSAAQPREPAATATPPKYDPNLPLGEE